MVTQPLSKLPGECGGTSQKTAVQEAGQGGGGLPSIPQKGNVSKGFSFSVSNTTRIYTKLLLLFQLLLDKPVNLCRLVVLFSKNCLKEELGGPTKINAIFLIGSGDNKRNAVKISFEK